MTHALAGPLSKKLCQLMLMMLALAAPLSKLCQLMLMMLGLAGPLSKPCQLMLVMLGLTAPLSKPSQLMLMMLGLTAPLSKKALPADAHDARSRRPAWDNSLPNDTHDARSGRSAGMTTRRPMLWTLLWLLCLCRKYPFSCHDACSHCQCPHWSKLMLMMLALAAPLVEHVQADADDVDLPAMLIVVLPSGAHDAFSYCSS